MLQWYNYINLLHWTPFCSWIRHFVFRQKVKAIRLVQYYENDDLFYVLALRSSDTQLSVYNHMVDFRIVIKE